MLDPMAYYPDPNSGCWIWAGAVSDTGYGNVYFDGKVILAHRLAYLLEIGPIPGGHDLHHICELRCCVNPYHLRPVTRKEHWGEHHELPTHCVNGHEWNDINTYIRPDNGKRACRACKRERMRRYAKR